MGRKYGFSAVQILKKWPWQLAVLKARGPMKCADPLNGYLIASLYGSGCNRSFCFGHAGGWRRGFQHLPRFRPHANGGGVTSQRHCGGAEQLQWTVRVTVYKRWPVRNTALEMIYIDGHCVGA